MASRGRGNIAVSEDAFLDAVRKTNSLSNKVLARRFECTSKTIYRYKKENPDVVKKAEVIIAELSDLGLTPKLMSFDNFYNIPVIIEWKEMLDNRLITEKRKSAVIRSLWHVCKHLKQHPKVLQLEDCSRLNVKMRNMFLKDEKAPKGLSYTTLREALRSYFMLIKHLSGEYLTSKGIGKETLPNYGMYSKQRVFKKVREEFEKIILDSVEEYDKGLELLGIAKFMYYTGTRISATLNFNFNERRYELGKDIWMLEVKDKGEKGGIKWDKYLIGYALEEFKEYCSKRFNIPIDELEDKLPLTTDILFPSFSGKRTTLVGRIFKKALIKSGIKYKDFPPTHIWRHTFAQDFLRASGWNYDLCASLGGWKSTYVLKRAYGKMGVDAKTDGLKKAMGLPVTEETHELRW